VPRNDLLGHPKSQAGSGRSFGGVEGFEDLAEGPRAHAASVVRDGEPNSFSAVDEMGCRANPNAESPIGRHGIESIADKVDDDLPKFSLVAEEGSDGLVVGVHRDPRDGHSPDMKRDRTVNDFGYLNLSRARHSAEETEGL